MVKCGVFALGWMWCDCVGVWYSYGCAGICYGVLEYDASVMHCGRGMRSKV